MSPTVGMAVICVVIVFVVGTMMKFVHKHFMHHCKLNSVSRGTVANAKHVGT